MSRGVEVRGGVEMDVKDCIIKYRAGRVYIYQGNSTLPFMALKPIKGYESLFVVVCDLSHTFEGGTVVHLNEETRKITPVDFEV